MIPTNLEVKFNEAKLFLKISWDDMGDDIQVYRLFKNKQVGSRSIFSGLGKLYEVNGYFYYVMVFLCKIKNDWHKNSNPVTIMPHYPGVELIEEPKMYHQKIENTTLSQINCVGWYIYDLYDYPLPPKK